MGKISTLSFTCAKLSTLIEPLCCTTLTLLVRLRPVLVCPQSWTLPHLSSSPLLCLLTLSLPPPPPCVERWCTSCACRLTHTDNGLLIQTHNTTSEIHMYVWHYTPSHNTPSHMHTATILCNVQRQHATIRARVISGLWLLLSLNFEANHLLIKWLVRATQPLETAVLKARCFFFCFFLAV